MIKNFLKIIIGGISGALCGIILGFLFSFVIILLLKLFAAIFGSDQPKPNEMVLLIGMLSMGSGAIIGGVFGSIFALKKI
ncbi:hypothetical protein KKC32_02210 [Patescibacteria group bacterium]|nr:hypothetical protein [Patescibacteria group bacterium]